MAPGWLYRFGWEGAGNRRPMRDANYSDLEEFSAREFVDALLS